MATTTQRSALLTTALLGVGASRQTYNHIAGLEALGYKVTLETAA